MSKMIAGEEGAAFKEAYASLNAAQRQAVDTIEGPVMVIAGPGTGKTQILTLRIANILLQTDTKPENILALTFTESGAKAMRERLRRYVGAVAYRVNIFTFHGFAEYLIAGHPDSFTKVIGGRPASELEKIEILEAILEGGEVKLLRPMGDPTYYVNHILRMFSTLKQEYITPDLLAEIIEKQELELQSIEKVHEKGAHKGKVRGEYTKKEKSITKNRELLYVYRLYEKLLFEKRLYDFDDMIFETVHALQQDENLLLELQENYQYLLADEHQDVNGSQNKILELLSSYHEQPNLFVVGDEKQAIYRFQGASLENFLYFEERFPGTTMIELTENYRSGQMILDASHSLIKTETGPAADLRIPLTAQLVKDSLVEVRHFSHQVVEDRWVVELIESAIAEGVEPAEIAVIMRSNREVEELTLQLRKQGIAATASADGDILSHPIMHGVRHLIEAVVESKNERALFTVLHGAYWGISKNDLLKIAAAQSYRTTLLSILTDSDKLAELGVENIEAVQKIPHIIEAARVKMTTQSPHRVLEFLLAESGFLKQTISSDPYEGARVIRRIYDEIEAMVVRDKVSTLEGVAASFKKSIEYRLAINAPFIATSLQAVQVMTAHKSKGLEFAVVVLPHLIDSQWGGRKGRTYFDIPLTKHLDSEEFEVLDDERRLLYVGMTRAKQKLYLSGANTNTEGKELTPSRLLEDIDETKRAVIDTSSQEESFDPTAGLLDKNQRPQIEVDFLRKVLAERGLSATALNNYLKSPWNYLYRNVLRIPEVQPLHMQFGTAMHNVMEKVTAFHSKEKKAPSDTQVKDWLDGELSRLPISAEEYARRHEKGLEALYAYINHALPSLPAKTEEEFSLRVVLPTGLPEFPELTLTGKLDRLDFNADGQVERVFDYKTGKPKTRNVIEGKTKDSDGGYKRQLTFYALLLELYDDERYRCREGVLAFLEPDQKGVVHEEAYTITDEEITALKEELVAVVQEIISGEFLDSKCDPAVSDYCELVEMLRG